MCNACGFMCCAYDGFSGCGCDDCDCPACWSEEDDEFDDDDDPAFFCEPVDVGDELHTILAEALSSTTPNKS